MAGFTNRGKKLILDYYFRRQGSLPAKFYVALVTSAQAPSADTNLLSDLTQIASGNGYTSGGFELTPGTTDFDTMTEDDSADKGILQAKDIVFTASGGNLPASGDGARYAVLTDDNVVVANRQIFGFWDLVSDRMVSNGQAFTLQNLEIQFTE